MLRTHQIPSPCYLSSLHSSFSTSLKHCSSTNPMRIHPLLPTSLPVSTPNTIHHSHLTVCLPDSLNLTRCLSILLWTSACEYAGSRDFVFVGAVEVSSLQLRYDYDTRRTVQQSRPTPDVQILMGGEGA